MSFQEREYYLAFSVFPGIGPMRFQLLVKAFGSATAAWQQSQQDLLAIGLPSNITAQFVQFRQQFSITEYLDHLKKMQIRYLCLIDQDYPERLRQISDPPIGLFIKGSYDFNLLNHPRLLAVVGTRKVSPYGKQVTQTLCHQLVESGCVIVSGMALGVDGLAHQAALDRSGKTIAVLGCGVDIIAPATHRQLYEQICTSGGLIVSEMPPGHRPDRGLFPARNRIISGLSLAVVVTEGAIDSGSLITARYAADQGREVFAVPGSIFSQLSQGPHTLIKDGATLITSASDVLSSPGSISEKTISVIDVTSFHPAEQRIMTTLANSPRDIDDLCAVLGLTLTDVNQYLVALELRGLIVRDGLGIYSLTRSV